MKNSGDKERDREQTSYQNPAVIMIIAELSSLRPSLLLPQKTLCKRTRENYQEYA